MNILEDFLEEAGLEWSLKMSGTPAKKTGEKIQEEVLGAKAKR